MQKTWPRRQAMLIASLVALGAWSAVSSRPVGASRAPQLFVFLPTLIRVRALAPLIEVAMSGVEVTVFGRFADFMAAVERVKPEGALSLTEGLVALGLTPSMQGSGATGSSEPYVVVTSQKNLNIAELGTSTLGVVDIVGRRALPQLVANMLGLDTPPQLRRVLKVADLLPLLSLELADGIVVQERFLEEMRASSRMELNVLRPVGARLGRPALAYPRGAINAPIQAGLARLSAQTRDILGVKSWVQL